MQVGGSGPLDIMDELGAADAVASAFIDPISKELMRDPVTTADGQCQSSQPQPHSLQCTTTTPPQQSA